MRRFKTFIEATDIFGFGKPREEEPLTQDLNNEPLKQFNIESVMEFLSKKKLGVFQPYSRFMNEIQWGDHPGAVKLEISPRMSVFVKKMAFDKLGQTRWVTKRAFQLNRNGHGGYEDAVANEIYEVVKKASNDSGVPSPKEHYDKLEELVQCVASKMKRVSKDMFMFEGIKKVGRDNYIIAFNVRGQGVEARDHMRVEALHTQISYDDQAGSIRVTNYKVASPVGGPHSWKVQPSDLDMYFFPTQDREEIAEVVAVHFKYY